ncbi:MAG: hypothetical protein F6J87_21260, partial [Spirulina sp. SIO3F2]|nr:hypothetical protein [Spirulina sp. SIO3F2]
MTQSIFAGAAQTLTCTLYAGTIALGLTVGVIESVQAQTFQFEWDRSDANLFHNTSKCSTCFNDLNLPLGLNDKPGVHEFIQTTYNQQTEALSWTSAFSNSIVNGGWLVISDGPNPKKHDQEFAIFYLDGLNNKLTAYAYNGQNNSKSWQTNPFLQSWDNALTFTDDGNGNTALSFSIDASAINDRNDLGAAWQGIGFGEEVGIWFHAANIKTLQYDANDHLTAVKWGKAGWYDTGALDTEDVQIPEPGTILGLLAIV